MIQYLLECLAFQLLFLVVYDFFLKRETFFQWNRFYLIGTFVISLVLPWIKIEAFKTTVSQDFVAYPAFLWQLEAVEVVSEAQSENWLTNQPIEYLVIAAGMLLALGVFAYKLIRIYNLRARGTIRYYQEFTKVVVKRSELAFSFFKHIFLGDEIKQENQANIIAHELVHIKQWHSLDLLFFEIMRITLWFNPLVYVYQRRVSELHEFIADSVVAKGNKKEQYQLLLAEAFQTQHISFVNQFFKSSLIKKRIVMLSKAKSKKSYQFKYMLLVPLVLGMLAYTSCEQEIKDDIETNTEVSSLSDAALIASIEEEFKGKSVEEIIRSNTNLKTEDDFKHGMPTKVEFFRKIISLKMAMDIISSRHPSVQKREILYPSTEKYNSYVNRGKAFKILDNNLKTSINPKEYALRQVNKEDKNLGPGEFVKVANAKDLTGNEIRKVNQILEQIKGTERFLFLSDDTNSFLIKNITAELVDKQEVFKVKSNANSVPFAIVDEVPTFPGCENASDKKACFQEKLNEHIRKNFRYTEEAQEYGIQGRVSLVFMISKDGTVQNIKKRGPHELLENEAERIIKHLPKMTAGRQDGKAVNVSFSIPISFKMSGSTLDDKLKSENDVTIIGYGSDNNVPFATVDEVPTFPGCENASDKKACFQESVENHIRKHFNYPLEAQEKGIQGRVSLVFIISKDGNIQNIRKRGPHELLENEAVRIIKRLPKIQPGKHDGKAVDVPFSIPISFKLK